MHCCKYNEIMNIIRADFDWFSLLAILGAGIIGMVKARSNKTRRPQTTSPQRDYEYHEENEEEYTHEQETASSVFSMFGMDITPEKNAEELTIPSLFEAETESISTEAENEDFDIRQAIISNEILNRPQY